LKVANLTNCRLFGINVFINVIKRRCDNKKENIKKKDGEMEDEKKPTL